jgi:hypothetical protein
MAVAVSRHEHAVGIERIDVLDLVVLADFDPRRGRSSRQAPDEAGRLDGAVMRM